MVQYIATAPMPYDARRQHHADEGELAQLDPEIE